MEKTTYFLLCLDLIYNTYENFHHKYIIVYISSTAGTQKAPVDNSKLKGVGVYKYVSSKLEQC
jgi:hypothetical protein